MRERIIAIYSILIILFLLVGYCSWTSSLGDDYSSGCLSSEPDEGCMKQVLQDFEQYTEKGMNDWQVPCIAVAVVQGPRGISGEDLTADASHHGSVELPGGHGSAAQCARRSSMSMA